MSYQQSSADSIRPRSTKVRLSLALAVGLVVLVAGFMLKEVFAIGGRNVSYVQSFILGKPITGGYAGWVGAQITIGAEPVVVTALGRMMLTDNQRAHTLKLIDARSGKDLPGASVEISLSGRPAGKFVYGALAVPLTLSPQASYYLVSSESLGHNVGDFFHDYDCKVQTTGVARVDHGIFLEDNQWRSLGSSNEMFGPLDFRYRR